MPTDQTILVRYDEIFLKGKNQRRFTGALRRNIVRSTGLPHDRVRAVRGRIYADVVADEAPRALLGIRRTFGVRSASLARVLAADAPVAEVARVACDVARGAVAGGPRTFRVEARRAEKSYPVGSMEIAAEVGGAILEAVPDLKVKLVGADLEIGVEVRSEGIYVFGESVPGPGGMPVGTAGSALALVSGGIDSPVAAWLSMKRGVRTDALYFHSFPYTGDPAKEKVFDLARALAPWAPVPITVYVADVAPVLDALRDHTPEDYWTVLLRRAMFRVADRIARRVGYLALVTGESVAQVASQTLENMARAAEVTDLLCLRPLVGFDKHEIIEVAQRIGTFDISTRPHPDCCSVFVPRNPRTRASRPHVERAERPLDLDALADATLDPTRLEVWRVDAVGPTRHPHPHPLSRGERGANEEGRPHGGLRPRPHPAEAPEDDSAGGVDERAE